ELQRLAGARELIASGAMEAGERQTVEKLLAPQSKGGGGQGGPAEPFRRYRSSGGLEIWVGRNSRRNDELTFRHSRPGDVWLHARHASGAHVVLRWDKDERPPRRDLEEAAVLAALHSRARGSGHVPVDWTRRRYVRKAKGAPAGTVRIERHETVFVTPDPDLEEALREDELL
ncbi:MAG: NFACT RNA binding domain-containing protein, partial [Gemmatimonadota bacterium]|nr:NFACT RNA binding domain-containing protein [Gemmatimonadota bacterium]